MDLAPFESDASGIPDGSDLQYRRGALLLEYLPGAKRTENELVTRGLAVEALSGMQEIQKALVEHRDTSLRNLLITGDGRPV